QPTQPLPPPGQPTDHNDYTQPTIGTVPQQPAYPPRPGQPGQPPARPPQPAARPALPPAAPRRPGVTPRPAAPPRPGGPPPQPPPARRYIPVPGGRRPPAAPRPHLAPLVPGCLPALLVAAALLAVYLLAPLRANLLLIGIDYVESGSAARSDTIMAVSVEPLQAYVGVISIPRDLWVSIPGLGENRINTAHFYAEAQQPGSGPTALRRTIALNFGVDLPYYVRIRFEGFREVVDALGGVDIQLDEAQAGYEAGRHHLTGRKALAFVRSRSGSDDFYRMARGQLMVRALLKNMINPLKWPRLPLVLRAAFNAIDTNLPAWQWPRLGFALLRTGPNGIDSHVIDRQMVSPFTTSDGAMVLAPNWDAIRPLLEQVFGR
ncbi:MAG: LCP family protein, partial [Chloroflexota bacterium]